MKIIADESVDFAVITTLREAGFHIHAIVEHNPGWSDDEVLKFAFEYPAFLITEDKDFGELTYRLQKPNHGILLVRLTYSSANQKAKAVLEVIENHAERLQGAFSVLDEHRLRIRSL